uniref:Reverse transcriptase domain-containing protein n=1 Tax=Leptobrachium leishanense TaxID=445787 RepID=A0A8C5WKY5_9ANUR
MANIVLIPKEGKDREQCSSYRPISLLNCDVKLFAKIIATRLNPYIPSLIHLDQVGFVPHREARDNTTRTLHIIHAAPKVQGGLALLSTDAEKAFDRVGWDFLFATLRHLGLGPLLRSWIQALYTGPSARVCVNGAFTDSFPICNGTRQGCPLSPLLFILSLEPFLEAVRQHPDISGVAGGAETHKVTAYADDLLFFVSNPLISLPNILAVFEEYRKLANLKINFSKSSILNISVPSHRVVSMRHTLPFRWAGTRLKYLGVWLTVDWSRLYETNFAELVATFRRDLRAWDYPHISCLGRVSVLKMNILPRLLYLFQTLPITIPRSFFATLRSLVISYIWRHARPRISYDTMTRSRLRGGLGVPDFPRYYASCHILRAAEWTREGVVKRWKSVEQTMLEVPLAVLPWLPRSWGMRLARTSPFTTATLRCWHREATRSGLTTYPSPMTPITYYDGFLSHLGPRSLVALTTTPIPRVHHFLTSSGAIPLGSLLEDRPPTFLHHFKYRQVTNCLRRALRPHMLTRPLTHLERTCASPSPLSNGVSLIYTLLRDASSTIPPAFMGKWEMMLECTFTEEQWSDICELTHRCSADSRTQETAYKLLTLWYYTPIRLHTYSPDISPDCWRCFGALGSVIHLWECPLICPFWLSLHSIASDLLDTPPPFTLASMLLHHTYMSIASYKKTILPRILNVAKSLIPLYWKQIAPPPLREWFRRMEDLRAVEHLYMSATDQLPRYLSIWSQWHTLSTSSAFLARLGPAQSVPALPTPTPE